ncbi:MAG: sulfotransferase [Pseudomonadota bacterium]
MAKFAVENRQLLAIQQKVEALDSNSLQTAIGQVLGDLSRQPQNPVLNFTAGLMYSRLGSMMEAVDHLKRALKKARDNEIILGALAFIHANRLRDHVSAIEYLKRKLKLNRTDARTLYILANSHVELSQIDKALELLERAEKHANGELSSRIMALRVRCFQRQGNSEAARAELMRIADNEPSGVISVAEALARLPDNTDEQLNKLKSIIKGALQNQPDSFRNDMHKAMSANALGGIEEKQKNFDQAFNYFKQANELQPRDPASASPFETHEFDVLKSAFSAELFEKGIAGHQSEEQIFVLGMPRSGTTLIESILGAHPKIEDFGELDFFINQIHGLGITNPANLSKDQRIEFVKNNIQNAPADGFSKLGQQYIFQNGFGRFADKSKVDKMPHNFRALGLINLVFPNAKIIHAKRHPMDICLSIFKLLLPGYHTTFAQQLESLGQFYLEYAELMRYWQETLPIAIHEIRYEDMVVNTESEARSMIDFVGHEWSDACLANRTNKRDVNTASIWQVRQDIYNTSVQKWRIYKSQLAPLAEILANEIRLYEGAAQSAP